MLVVQWAFGWAPRFGLWEWEVTEASQVDCYCLALLLSERTLTVDCPFAKPTYLHIAILGKAQTCVRRTAVTMGLAVA